MKPRIVGIIGTGLIGGSIGMRARRDGALVVGYDREPGALAEALEVGAIDFAATRDELYARAATVVIASYVDATIAEIERLKQEGPLRASLIIDVASVKAPIVAAGDGLEGFVATHPMAGTERSGARAARATLFEGKSWAYVPSGDAPLDARARAFIGSLGALPIAYDAEEHDRIVAFSSHLPQLLATVYAARGAGRRNEAFEALIGATSKELFRLGESGFAMWHDVFRANAANVEPDLRAIAEHLLVMADAMRDGDMQRLREVFEGEPSAL